MSTLWAEAWLRTASPGVEGGIVPLYLEMLKSLLAACDSLYCSGMRKDAEVE